MTRFIDLPMDLEEEILSYVPATYLKRLKSTCKRWNRLFNGGDSRFAREHDVKAAKRVLVLMLKAYRICPTIVNLQGSVEVKRKLSLVDSRSKYSAQFDIDRVFHCDGLLLCTSEDESRFVVWNPFTGETRWFQPTNSGIEGRHFVLGYCQVDHNRSYKILSLYRNRRDFEIYEFSSDSWRTLDDVITPGWCIVNPVFSVSLKRNTYLFATDGTEAQHNISLFKFDFLTEKFVPLPLPYQCHVSEIEGLSVVREEKLSVLIQHGSRSNTEIWVTNKIDEATQVLSWSKVLALDLIDLQPLHQACFLLNEEKKVVMICDRWLDLEDETKTKAKDMIYIVGEANEVTQVEFRVKKNDACSTAILNYVPSLVQIEQAGGKMERAVRVEVPHHRKPPWRRWLLKLCGRDSFEE